MTLCEEAGRGPITDCRLLRDGLDLAAIPDRAQASSIRSTAICRGRKAKGFCILCPLGNSFQKISNHDLFVAQQQGRTVVLRPPTLYVSAVAPDCDRFKFDPVAFQSELISGDPAGKLRSLKFGERTAGEKNAPLEQALALSSQIATDANDHAAFSKPGNEQAAGTPTNLVWSG